VTLQDGLGGVPNWPLQANGWAPSIAGVRTSPLGGRGPYADAEEELEVGILGATASACYSNLDTLSRLLDKAERWWLRGENISPVILKYAPMGSTIHDHVTTPLQAIVLGRAGSDERNGVELPKDVSEAGMLFTIYGIKIVCLRRGAWTGATDTTSTSGSAANPSVLTRAFSTTHTVNSPMNVTIGGFDRTATPTINAGFLCVGSNVNDIQFNQGSLVAGYTSVADAAALAKFGTVVRYTPTGTTAVASGTGSYTTALTGPIVLIAAVRNNSATTTFAIRGDVYGAGGNSSTPYQVVDTSTTNPRLIVLGTVVGNPVTNVGVTIQASAASGTFDVNYILSVNLRDETCTVLAHDSVSVALISSGAVTLNFAYNPILDQNPRVYASGTSANAAVVYRGAMPLLSTGINAYVTWAATNGTYWVFTNVSNAVVNLTLNVSRYRSYLSPI
jgi:hypothetical protein